MIMWLFAKDNFDNGTNKDSVLFLQALKSESYK